MYVEIRTGKEVDIRKAAPNVSWPRDPSDEALSAHGFQRVTLPEKPVLAEGQYADPGPLIKIGESWSRTWIVKEAAPVDPDILDSLAKKDTKEWTDDELRRAVQALILKG